MVKTQGDSPRKHMATTKRNQQEENTSYIDTDIDIFVNCNWVC